MQSSVIGPTVSPIQCYRPYFRRRIYWQRAPYPRRYSGDQRRRIFRCLVLFSFEISVGMHKNGRQERACPWEHLEASGTDRTDGDWSPGCRKLARRTSGLKPFRVEKSGAVMWWWRGAVESGFMTFHQLSSTYTVPVSFDDQEWLIMYTCHLIIILEKDKDTLFNYALSHAKC